MRRNSERIIRIVFTLYGSRWADDEGLLERLALATQLRWAALKGDAGLGQTWDVYGSLLIKSWLVIEERHCSSGWGNLRTYTHAHTKPFQWVSWRSITTKSIKRTSLCTHTAPGEYRFLNQLLSNLYTVKMIKYKTKAQICNPQSRSTVSEPALLQHVLASTQRNAGKNTHLGDILCNQGHNVKLVRKE